VAEASSWRAQFEESLARFAATGGGGTAGPSIDAYLEGFPIEPDHQYGAEMDELHRAALRALVGRLIPFISNDLENGIRMCESPPERAMLYALALVAWEWTDGVLVRDHISAGGLINTRGVFLEIAPQTEVGPYRVDFLLTMRLRADGERLAKMVVECDGHDFHERTKEQASRDRARDRYLQSCDLPVYRYTGSDVWKDVFRSAHDAVGELMRRFGD
jgi:very-short-patch-repair endonuclease